MEYQFTEIEKKWKKKWKESNLFKVVEDSSKPKYYVLDMFPYPSGAGLHVGHPLGYIATDIIARYKKLKGFNVLHPMGFDSFGLPAEQYAIKTGQHPAKTTDDNIATFKKQLENIGFCYDWSREVRTSDPKFYKWTQWIFKQLFNSWFDRRQQKAFPIETLIEQFQKSGSQNVDWFLDDKEIFNAEQWQKKNELEKDTILMKYRLAYLADTYVNWCPQLGTVLANDEVINGKSEREGYPVERKLMRQWFLRITEYADRLLEGLEKIEFSDSMKEMQKNWIGKSVGAEIDFPIENKKEFLKVFTTRPETLFGVDFMVIAPEHPLVDILTTASQKKKVDMYLEQVKSKSELDRISEVKKVSGVDTGSFCVRPFDNKKIPIWISDYVLINYGTGAIMAVPCGDERDFAFASHFHIPITNIYGERFDGKTVFSEKAGILFNSHFLTGMDYKTSVEKILQEIVDTKIGKKKINYKMHDAGFGRQRYWGEPFPIIYDNKGKIHCLDDKELPLLLPDSTDFMPVGDGTGPLGKITHWVNLPNGQKRETDTMPGYAGSSWYFLRYMDPDNNEWFCDKKKSDYWGQVDLYLGGTEHAVGHLLYSRMWNNFLYDRGMVAFAEPYKKLINQGMITGNSRMVYRVGEKKCFVSAGLKNKYEDLQPIHINVYYVDGFELKVEEFIKGNPNFKDYEFVKEDGKFLCEGLVEKMSKRKLNTVNPDDVIAQYGADCFRMYEMFLGPIELSKPWDTKGIEGVSRFLKKFWRLFYDEKKNNTLVVTNEEPTHAEWKALHQAIKKIEQDIERFSLNTVVSNLMIATNELTDLQCHKKKILEPLLILISPYAPFLAEELWHTLGHTESIHHAQWVNYDETYLVESSKTYPVSVNGKVRAQIELSLDAEENEVRKKILALEVIQKWLEGKEPKKFIYVKSKMINVVV